VPQFQAFAVLGSYTACVGQLVTVVVGQPVDPMSQAVQFCLKCLNLEGGTDGLS
jgi:hypothetical protein